LTRTEMGTGGDIRGLEVEFQKRLTFLPRPFNGLGVSTNYTWLDATGHFPGRADHLPLVRTAKRNGNFNVFYAYGPWDFRVFVNYRSPYLSSVGARPALDAYQDERSTLNFFGKYKVTERVTLNLDVNNATDAISRTYQGNPTNPTGVRYFDW